MQNKCCSWREHHCSVYSARDSFRASWSSGMCLINAGFRSAALQTAAEGEGNRRDHLQGAPTQVMCPEGRTHHQLSHLPCGCWTFTAQGLGLTGHFPLPSPGSCRLEAASSHNTAIAPMLMLAEQDSYKKPQKGQLILPEATEADKLEFLKLLGRNMKE